MSIVAFSTVTLPASTCLGSLGWQGGQIIPIVLVEVSLYYWLPHGWAMSYLWDNAFYQWVHVTLGAVWLSFLTNFVWLALFKGYVFV